MGLSQDEIDKLVDTTADAEDSDDTIKTVLTELVTKFAVAIENIIPVLVGSTTNKVIATDQNKQKFGDLVSSLSPDNTYFVFKEPSLSSGVLLGFINLPTALEISQKMMGQEGAEELDEGLLTALTEALNNILGAYDTSLAEGFKLEVEHSDLKILEDKTIESLQTETGYETDTDVWFAPLEVTIDELTGNMGFILSEDTLKEITEKHPSAEAAANGDEIAAEEPQEDGVAGEAAEPDVEVQTVRYEDLEPRQPTGSPRGIDLIMDVPLSITVELGRKSLAVKDILTLTPGSLVELDKLAGEAVDLLVNGKLFARGEVVVIDENFGVRVSTILTHKERIERLGEDS